MLAIEHRSFPILSPSNSPGLELSRRLHFEVIAPLIAQHYPFLRYAAARLDGGSDVLGFDTAISRDHGWGPRLTLFLDPSDLAAIGSTLHSALETGLPPVLDGIPTRFAQPTPDAPDAFGHGVRITTIAGFFQDWIGCDPQTPLSTADWLAAPAQRLRTVADGPIWHDGLGELVAVRDRLAWYPPDLWRGLLAVQWGRVAEQEPFMARCGDVGDELGARLVAGRQVRELMRVVFLLARAYPPYAKWFGSAFRRLPAAATLGPHFDDVLGAPDWRSRERALIAAYAAVGALQNEAALAPPVELTPRRYQERPYQILGAERFATALESTLPASLAIGVGAAWQWVDDAAIDEAPARARAIIDSQRTALTRACSCRRRAALAHPQRPRS